MININHMALRFNHQPEKFLCERCRKPLGARQLDCPRRQGEEAERCAYQLESARVARSGTQALAAGIVFLGLAIWLFIGFEGHSATILVVKLLLSVFGLGLAFLGCCRLWGRVETGRNLNTGQTWQRKTLFSVELDWCWRSASQSVAWPGSPARVIRYPASVAEFCRHGNAVDIVSTALLQLIAQGILSLGKQEVQRRFGRRRTQWLIMKGRSFGSETPLGLLETRMQEIVTAASQYGLPLDEFLLTLFEGGHSEPRNFVIDQFVGPDAVSLGLGKVIGARERALAPGPNVSARVGRDIQSVEQLYRDLWISSPEDAADLLLQVDRQIFALMRRWGISEKTLG